MTPYKILVGALAVLVAGVGSAGFVTATGGGIEWARFHAAYLPADQAVAAVPNKELVVIGAVALVGFLIAAVAAVALVYWIDSEGKVSRATARGLVALMLLEILVALWHGPFALHTAILLGGAFLAGAAALVSLVEAVLRFRGGPTALDPNRPAAIAAMREVLTGGEWNPFGARRGAALLLLAGGAIVVARADQWFQVVIWALAAIVVGALWNAFLPHRGGTRFVVLLALVAYGTIALFRFEPWLGRLTVAAVGLAAVNIGVARATGRRFAFYGAAVFLSVVLFGALLSYARTIESPKLQGVAVLVKNGSRAECGLYVAETDSRLYLARVTVVPRANRTKVVPGSGRIYWLPRDQIERTELGALQTVAGAQEDASALRDELVAERRLAGAGPVGGPAEKKGAVAAAVDANECTPNAPPLPPRPTPERELARRFQPRVILDRTDGFWPISALTIFELTHGGGRTCRQVGAGECVRVTKPSQLPWIGGTGEWLDYPAPNTNKDAQHNDMVDALRSPDPARTAREYFFSTGGSGQPTSLQYWFYYGFNYQSVGLRGLPILGRAGFHEGDFESLGLLLSTATTPRAVYAWMARHSDEGRPFVASESQLRHSGDHLNVYAALGSHATYDSCGTQHRVAKARGLINDRPQCDPAKQLALEPEITPLSDLAFAPWACWQGRFGHVAKDQIPAAGVYFAAGPRSPLWQQDFGGVPYTPCSAVREAPQRPDAGEEVLADGVGKKLRENGGRLDRLFDTCPAWSKPPASGIYVVACDGGALSDFFKSGLTDMHGRAISIRGPRDPAAEPESIPAIYRRADALSPDGVSMTASQPAVVSVYAACYSGEHSVVASFPPLALTPGRPVTLRTGDASWALAGAARPVAVKPATQASTARCRP